MISPTQVVPYKLEREPKSELCHPYFDAKTVVLHGSSSSWLTQLRQDGFEPDLTLVIQVLATLSTSKKCGQKQNHGYFEWFYRS